MPVHGWTRSAGKRSEKNTELRREEINFCEGRVEKKESTIYGKRGAVAANLIPEERTRPEGNSRRRRRAERHNVSIECSPWLDADEKACGFQCPDLVGEEKVVQEKCPGAMSDEKSARGLEDRLAKTKRNFATKNCSIRTCQIMP